MRTSLTADVELSGTLESLTIARLRCDELLVEEVEECEAMDLITPMWLPHFRNEDGALLDRSAADTIQGDVADLDIFGGLSPDSEIDVLKLYYRELT